MKGSYREALGYAFKLNREKYKDIVHDSYLTWYDKTGKNLFDEHRGVRSQVVRNISKASHGHGTFMWRRNVYLKVMIECRDSYNSGEENNRKDYHIHKLAITPEDIMIAKETREQVVSKLTEKEKDVFELLEEGYKTVEIGKILNSTPQNAGYFVRNIRKKLVDLN